MTDHALPTVRLTPNRDRPIRAGRPWVYGNEAEPEPALKSLAPGALVNIVSADGRHLGTATWNRHTLIAGRLYARHPDAQLDAAFLARRLRAALDVRTRLFPTPHYRLVHAEGDDLPGFVIDRFDDAVTVQANTAGAELLLPAMVAALERVLEPKLIVLRGDTEARRFEGLEPRVEVLRGEAKDAAFAVEGGLRFPVDPVGGQKTGWYYDLVAARTLIAALAPGRTVLDLYCNAGPFGLRAAAAGATRVHAVDASDHALRLAAAAARLNGVADKVTFERADVFDVLPRQLDAGERHDVVIADPPSFVKSRKDLGSGARGYRKLARLAAAVTAPQGLLFIASCSHNMPADRFDEEVAAGLGAAQRSGTLIAGGGAGPDHPVPLSLPEAAYLKWRILRLD